MAISAFNLILSTLSLTAGIWAFVTTQAVTKEHFEPIVAACTSKDVPFTESGYHVYDGRVGLVVFDFLVCLVTQFMVDLVTIAPTGLLTWGATILAAVPAVMVMMLEANRRGNTGPLKWPFTICLLGQIVGISVVFPVIWVPSYCFFAGSNATASATLAKMLVLFVLPLVCLTIAVFTLDIQSDAWTICAGSLGGPVACTLCLIPTFVAAPEAPTSQELKDTAKASALSFGVGGLVATCGWIYMMYVAYTSFGTDYIALGSALWAEAHPAVKFMTIDASILWLALILHIASRSLNSAVEAVLLTPVFGPGGACCMSLASLEVDRSSLEPKVAKKD